MRCWGFFLAFAREDKNMMDLKYGPRTERVLIRLRPEELERAHVLAKSEEVRVPELLRRLLQEKWRAAGAEHVAAGEV
jgi:hypothetical protein